MGELGAEGRLRRRPPLGGPRDPVGRVPAAVRVRLRGGVRRPQHHAGRLLPVRHGREPRLPQLAALPAADGLRRAGAGARDPALLDQVAAAGRRREPAGALRHRSAVHALRPRHLERPRLLAAARRGRVRPRHARHEVLRRAAHLLRHDPEGERVGAHQGGVRPPGDAARTARRLRDGRDRRLERLLDRARAASRVEPRDRAARLRLPEARGAGRPARRQGVRGPAARGGGGGPRDHQGPVDRALVHARLVGLEPGRHRRDLRGAAAMGDPRRRADARAGRHAGGEHPPLPRRLRRAGGPAQYGTAQVPSRHDPA